ncbi:M23 family metallopeptidase [Sulfurimonas sediminis]|uniref:M23 family metallopeptidase n=1 Tax=Sulfurimonas sediminis TaxID=2590020 RepID=A0A7M1B382_9BACT|nr:MULTISPECIES: M23 family metallopeptidase [Sulfurimonas]QOP43132.1 M23 family metallopeptidase [Sulfurimonas sediminis]UCN01026.1 M23 family metallopeptidase [Sulfurimonas sp. SWIR-19]
MRNKKNRSSVGGFFITALLIGAGAYVYFSAMFERNAPVITLQTNGYWNLKKPLPLKIEDESGIKSYKVILRTKNGESELLYNQLLYPEKAVSLKLEPPRGASAIKDKNIEIVVQAQDASKWNFLNGNTAVKSFKLRIDKKRPQVNIVNNSYKISRGGAALVIFKAEDENLKELYIKSNHNKHFKVEPFYKEGYYIALLAWPVQDEGFKATVVAKDSAGNVRKTYVPLYLKNKTYRLSKITISDKFLNGKIAELAEEFDETQGVEDPLERFKIINENIREKNEALIHKLTSDVPQEMISDFKIKKMYPLKNGKVVAYFGDHRKYYYKGQFISEAYHLGLDMASHAMAPIRTQNGGNVVFADYNGLYGNSPIIAHGLGLYTLYGHCSSLEVSAGDEVAPNSVIAKTGKTGYAMGDHLHFGVLVQGIEVRPQEWMDKKWIKLNINDIIKSAKKIIDGK